MKIRWQLDDSEPLDVADLLGSIELHANDGAVVRDQVTYLDSWFLALLDAAIAARRTASVTVDLVDEPDPLILTAVGDRLHLQYGNQRLVTFPLDLETELAREVTVFLGSLPQEAAPMLSLLKERLAELQRGSA